MTTIAEFKKMLQEEINEPLDYPRVPGLTPEELREYNEGYRAACNVLFDSELEWTDEDWLNVNLDCVPKFLNQKPLGNWRDEGRLAAYTWALAELKALEPEEREGAIGTILIPRARYNYLLDLERSVTEFAESFTKWDA